jgi:sulfopyruvate decarboxylase subunit alpha
LSELRQRGNTGRARRRKFWTCVPTFALDIPGWCVERSEARCKSTSRQVRAYPKNENEFSFRSIQPANPWRQKVLGQVPARIVGTIRLLPAVLSSRIQDMAQAELILGELKKCNVTDVVGLPDNSSAALLQLLRQDENIRLHAITREGEAFALAAGLWMGGRNPLVLIQNTGLLESGDSVRGTVLRMRIPILCFVTYRGYAKMQNDAGTAYERLDVEILSRHDLDSVALMTEPTLRAWGMPFDFLHTNEDVSKILSTFQKAQESIGPRVLLVTQDMS